MLARNCVVDSFIDHRIISTHDQQTSKQKLFLLLRFCCMRSKFHSTSLKKKSQLKKKKKNFFLKSFHFIFSLFAALCWNYNGEYRECQTLSFMRKKNNFFFFLSLSLLSIQRFIILLERWIIFQAWLLCDDVPPSFLGL